MCHAVVKDALQRQTYPFLSIPHSAARWSPSPSKCPKASNGPLPRREKGLECYALHLSITGHPRISKHQILNPPASQGKGSEVVYLFYRWENGVRERCNDLLKIIQQFRDRFGKRPTKPTIHSSHLNSEAQGDSLLTKQR